MSDPGQKKVFCYAAPVNSVNIPIPIDVAQTNYLVRVSWCVRWMTRNTPPPPSDVKIDTFVKNKVLL